MQRAASHRGSLRHLPGDACAFAPANKLEKPARKRENASANRGRPGKDLEE
jgi:hypothetical protein